MQRKDDLLIQEIDELLEFSSGRYNLIQALNEEASNEHLGGVLFGGFEV